MARRAGSPPKVLVSPGIMIGFSIEVTWEFLRSELFGSEARIEGHWPAVGRYVAGMGSKLVGRVQIAYADGRHMSGGAIGLWVVKVQ